jgi:hypothetical protein
MRTVDEKEGERRKWPDGEGAREVGGVYVTLEGVDLG